MQHPFSSRLPPLSAANPTSRPAKYHEPIKIEKKWRKYNPGKINFSIQSPETDGAKIYSNIVKDPDTYITDNARRVLQTLYFSPKDSIPNITDIDYVVRKFDGISYKSGGGKRVRIDYSTDWVEKSFVNNDTLKLDYETRRDLSRTHTRIPALTQGSRRIRRQEPLLGIHRRHSRCSSCSLWLLQPGFRI